MKTFFVLLMGFLVRWTHAESLCHKLLDTSRVSDATELQVFRDFELDHRGWYQFVPRLVSNGSLRFDDRGDFAGPYKDLNNREVAIIYRSKNRYNIASGQITDYHSISFNNLFERPAIEEPTFRHLAILTANGEILRFGGDAEPSILEIRVKPTAMWTNDNTWLMYQHKYANWKPVNIEWTPIKEAGQSLTGINLNFVSHFGSNLVGKRVALYYRTLDRDRTSPWNQPKYVEGILHAVLSQGGRHLWYFKDDHGNISALNSIDGRSDKENSQLVIRVSPGLD